MTWAVCDPDGRVLLLDNSDAAPEGGVLVEPTTAWPVPPTPGEVLHVVEGALAWVNTDTVEQARSRRWAVIKAQRDAVEFGGFTWDGSAFDSDAQSQPRIMGAVQMATLAAAAGQSFGLAWTLADNSVRTLDGADMIAVGLALGAHVGTAHAIARTLREQIEAAATVEDVAAIDWPSEGGA